MRGRSIAFIVIPLTLVGGVIATEATSRPAASVTLYDSDPNHLWNRLDCALFARQAAGEPVVGLDEVDPYLWANTWHLLIGPSHQRAVELLDEFLSRHGGQMISDPLKQAVLQNDLWSVFDWAASEGWGRSPRSGTSGTALTACWRLASAIRQLELSDDQIRALPDNLTAAVKSRAFAAEYSADQADRAFVPADLFDPQGPWVCVGNSGQTVKAKEHAIFASGRSAFFVFISLPGGRAATLDYLKKLNEFPRPWLSNPHLTHSGGRDLLVANPDTPQFAEGTKVALVRRMVLIDDSGQLVVSPVTQSLQMRVYRKIAAVNGARFRDAQDVFELQFRRAMLFGGENGGLHAVTDDDRASVTVMGVFGGERFETHEVEDARHKPPAVLQSCSACHRDAGIQSVLSYTQAFRFDNGPTGTPVSMTPIEVKNESAVTLEATKRRYDWGLLRGFLESEKH